ncbi:MAG: 2-amino-4-hydroxy-6-hydroxymethyldihydropteridine diphosphokinase [Synechococcus sp.]
MPSESEPAGASLAIGLGANLGDPAATLTAVRPPLAEALRQWWPGDGTPELAWSPLFRTAPVGGPPGQPDYLNAVLLARGAALAAPEATAGDPEALLRALQALELRFGRERREHWGPRRLDLDLLWCGPRPWRSASLLLPHPLWSQRGFVLAPLAALVPHWQPPGCGEPVAARLAAVLASPGETAPERLPPRRGWPA